LLFALAVYVVLVAAWGFWQHEGEAFSWRGLALTVLAIPVMYRLARRKRAVAVEAIACSWLSCVVVVGLLAQHVLAAWWVDSVTSLAIVWLLFKEAREAWGSESADDG
jgi:divalent metal cation (Fe/Co/Zn/Cd) transporter